MKHATLDKSAAVEGPARSPAAQVQADAAAPLDFDDQRPVATAQQELMRAIADSPRMAAQRRQLPGTANKVIQREVMTADALAKATQHDTSLTEREDYIPLLKALALYWSQVSKAKELDTFNDKDRYLQAASAVYMAAANQVKEALGRTNSLMQTLDEASPIKGLLAQLRMQLHEEAMVQVVDAGTAAGAKFEMVAIDPARHGEKVGANGDGTGGRLRVLRDKLGSGAINTVSLVEDMVSAEQFIFKPDRREGMVALDNVDAPVNNRARGFADRAVATYRLDQLLGFNLTPTTRYASVAGYFGHVMKMAQGASPQQTLRLPLQAAVQAEAPLLATAARNQKLVRREENIQLYYDEMRAPSLVQGKGDVVVDLRREIGSKFGQEQGQKYVIKHAMFDFDYSDPAIQEGLTSLHLLDLIAGQLDRHPGNYFIGFDASSRSLRVTAIDNDAAFGADHADLTKTTVGSHLPGLPSVVSKAQWARIDSVGEEDIRKALRDTVNPTEVFEAVKRFTQLKAHLKSLDDQGLLVAQFDQHTFQTMVAEDTATSGIRGKPQQKRSYVGRDANLLRHRARESEGRLVLSAEADRRTAQVPHADPSDERRYEPVANPPARPPPGAWQPPLPPLPPLRLPQKPVPPPRTLSKTAAKGRGKK